MTRIPDTRPDAVIFDLDGTLLDTEPLYTRASQHVLDRWGKTFDLALKRRIMGGDSRRSAQIVIDHFSLPISVDEYLEEREARLEALFPEVTEIEGAGQFVEFLKHAGITMGLATSSHSRLCKLKLQGKAWANHFDAVVCGDSPDLENPKPAPDIFILCARAAGVAPNTCIAIEDSPNGITAATNAGMTVIAINSPWVAREDLSDASMIVDSYHELLAMDIWK